MIQNATAFNAEIAETAEPLISASSACSAFTVVVA